MLRTRVRERQERPWKMRKLSRGSVTLKSQTDRHCETASQIDTQIPQTDETDSDTVCETAR